MQLGAGGRWGLGRIVLAFACVTILASCGEVGMIASPDKDFATSDVLELSAAARNFIPVASNVGTSLGYDLAGTDAAHNTVTLANNPSVGEGVLIGKMEASRVTLTLEPGGREIKIDIALTGNFDTATPQAATERLSKLKAALSAAFRS